MYRGRYVVPFSRSYGTNGRKKFKNEVKASVGENAAMVRGKRLANVRVSKYERTNERTKENENENENEDANLDRRMSATSSKKRIVSRVIGFKMARRTWKRSCGEDAATV